MTTAISSTSTTPLSELPPICRALFEAKAASGLTFEQIAKEMGRGEVWVASVFYGQAKPTPSDLKSLALALQAYDPNSNIDHSSLMNQLGDDWFPVRGLGPMPPTDPVLYRLYEGLLVYGYPIKAIIHEKFGDGIMSMINCKVDVERKSDPEGDRVVLTFDGKFLPYSKW